MALAFTGLRMRRYCSRLITAWEKSATCPTEGIEREQIKLFGSSRDFQYESLPVFPGTTRQIYSVQMSLELDGWRNFVPSKKNFLCFHGSLETFASRPTALRCKYLKTGQREKRPGVIPQKGFFRLLVPRPILRLPSLTKVKLSHSGCDPCVFP